MPSDPCLSRRGAAPLLPGLLHPHPPLVTVGVGWERSRYEPPAAGRRLGMSGTILIFGAALAILVWVPRSPLVRIAPSSRMAVTFELAPTPAAPPAPPAEVPPGPLQQEQDAASTSRPVPPSAPQIAPLPEQNQPAAAAAVQAEEASTAARRVEQTTAPPAIANQASSVAARTNSAATAQAALANWQSELLGHLKRYLRYPRPSQSAREEGIAQVTITVDRQGRVLGARLARGSGYPLLDGEAVAMVRRGSPVPPPSADIPGDPVIVTIPILFSLRR
ncbi:energy transducer TonB family protein [Sphingomonas pituitosa]|uniref:energy transducer TonB family protein n=1 Tax=Sphingomonas pituitosa TaxID=99597 RepID=UPI000A01F5FD|nr:energy transducer TonB [Sphingomonas pituitosa]